MFNAAHGMPVQEISQPEILSGLTTAIIWLDKFENIGFINLAASELLQLSSHRVLGVNWRYILPKLLNEIHHCGTGRITIHEYEIRLPDAIKIHVTCTISFYEMDGEDGWLIEMYNTERHHRIVEEDERWHQYEAGNLLVKTLAHEIKNPLAGIYGAAQLLRKRFPDNLKADKFLEIISDEVSRLTNLVDRMLGPKQKADKESHNIHEIFAYVLELIEPEKPGNISIKIDFDPSIPDVSMDFSSMVQAVLNLVKNAIQAMSLHGGLLTIRSRVESKFTLGTKTYPLIAVLSIIDEGEGIPVELVESIFFPMVTSKKEGTGLGLSVAQNIVRDHGGLIVAESEPGHTCFNIYLPFDHNRHSQELS